MYGDLIFFFFFLILCFKGFLRANSIADFRFGVFDFIQVDQKKERFLFLFLGYSGFKLGIFH